MKRILRYCLVIVFLFLPVSFYQNCADMMVPEHDVESGSSASLDDMTPEQLKAEATAIATRECSSCHNSAVVSGGINTIEGPGLVSLGAIVAGQPDSSSWYTRLQSGMPPTGPLSNHDQEVIRQWILRGNPGN